jgi:hypothetical protein
MPRKKELVQLITVPRIFDECTLCFVQKPDHINFPIKRVYYILDRFSKQPRGYHAHKKTRQVLFCLKGSIKIILDNGKQKAEVILKRPEDGLMIENAIWHEMHNFKKNTVLLVLASKAYDDSDYIRDYKEFLEFIKANEKN